MCQRLCASTERLICSSSLLQSNKSHTHLHPDQLIVLESTTYPGATEEIVLPRLNARFSSTEDSHPAEVGRDFYLAFSPERIEPGNSTYFVTNTPKIIGGVTPRCTHVAKTFYEQFINKTHTVSSPRTAEMVKLLENTFRSVNIGLINEIALICDRMDLDVWEVIDAAATKPFGFMPFYPGPRTRWVTASRLIRIISLGRRGCMNTMHVLLNLPAKINNEMPKYVVDKIVHALNLQRKSVARSAIVNPRCRL